MYLINAGLSYGDGASNTDVSRYVYCIFPECLSSFLFSNRVPRLRIKIIILVTNRVERRIKSMRGYPIRYGT